MEHNLMVNAGLGGRCCHLVLSCWNGPEGLVPELSLEICATGLVGVQLSHWYRVGRAAIR